MDVYHIWFNLKDGVGDLEFADAARAYLDHLREQELIAGYRLTRRKLGLGHPNLPEWHIAIDFADLSQLDRAFGRVAARALPVESLHHAVNAKARDVFFALHRDFPDEIRVRGQEQF
jgi:hypothetical protein